MPSNTIIAFLASGIERYNNFIAHLQFRDFVAFFDNGTDKFVAADEVRRAFEVAAIEMKVGSLHEELYCQHDTIDATAEVALKLLRGCETSILLNPNGSIFKRTTYTEGSRRHFQDSVRRILQAGIRAVFDGDLYLFSIGATDSQTKTLSISTNSRR